MSFPRRQHERLRGCPILIQVYRLPLHLLSGLHLPHLHNKGIETPPLHVCGRRCSFIAAEVVKSRRLAHADLEI